jgi:hypothetical protein
VQVAVRPGLNRDRFWREDNHSAAGGQSIDCIPVRCLFAPPALFAQPGQVDAKAANRGGSHPAAPCERFIARRVTLHRKGTTAGSKQRFEGVPNRA